MPPTGSVRLGPCLAAVGRASWFSCFSHAAGELASMTIWCVPLAARPVSAVGHREAVIRTHQVEPLRRGEARALPPLMCIGGTVTFQAVPSSGSSWCLGQPENCTSAGSSISDVTGSLWLSALCSTDCQTCQRNTCHSVLCAPPVEVTTPTTIYEWDGIYYQSGTTTCSSGATSCAAAKCAKPGLYFFMFSAFLNPAPGTPNGCSLAPSATPVTSITGTFTYPTDTNVFFGM